MLEPTAVLRPARRLRILMSAYSCAPNRGSELANGWNWPISMARRGHDVTVVTTPRFRDEILAAVDGLEVSPPKFEFVDDALPYSPWRRGQIGVYARYLTWQRRIVATSSALHRTRDFDVVHHVSWGSLRGGSRLDALDLPLIFGPVGGGQIAPHRFLSYFGSAAPAEAVRSLFATVLAGSMGNAKAAVLHAATVLAANRETLQLASQLGGRSVQFFQDTGIESSLLEGIPNRDWQDPTLRLLWVGRLFPHKGLRIAFEAMARLPADTPVQLVVVGDGPERRRLMGAARSLGVSDRIVWRGQVPWREAISAMDASHALLFTSLRETGGAQLLEALARGLPVITLDHQGAADQVPDEAGIKIPVTTPRQVAQAMARAICETHGQRQMLAEYSKTATSWAATQTWDQKALQMEQIYLSAIDAHAGRPA